MHYFPKAKIGEFKIEAFDIAIGDTILITGPTTGAQEMEVTEMFVNDLKGNTAKKGDSCTIPLTFRIRPSDKLYKIVSTKVEA
jgi:putative protease